MNLRARKANCGNPTAARRPQAASRQPEGSGNADSGPKASCGKADCPKGSGKVNCGTKASNGKAYYPEESGKASCGPNASKGKADCLF